MADSVILFVRSGDTDELVKVLYITLHDCTSPPLVLPPFKYLPEHITHGISYRLRCPAGCRGCGGGKAELIQSAEGK